MPLRVDNGSLVGHNRVHRNMHWHLRGHHLRGYHRKNRLRGGKLGGWRGVNPTVPIFNPAVDFLHGLPGSVFALSLVAKTREQLREKHSCNDQANEHDDHHYACSCAHIENEGIGVGLEGGAMVKQLGFRGGSLLGLIVTHDENFLPLREECFRETMGVNATAALK